MKINKLWLISSALCPLFCFTNSTLGKRGDNTAYGTGALNANGGTANAAFGYDALYPNDLGDGNTACGYNSLETNTSGSFNTAVGSQSLSANTTSTRNTAIGANAMYQNTTGSNNCGIGYLALQDNTTAAYNTAVGCYALYAVAQGSNNIALGYQAGYNIEGTNNIDIGNEGISGDTGVIRIGNTNTTTATYIAGISGEASTSGAEVYVDASGKLGTTLSSERYKQNIQSMGDASEILLSLHPVKFQYKPGLDPKGVSQFGLVAEEVEKVDPDLVLRDGQNRPNSVRYQAVNAMLLNEFIKQHNIIDGQKGIIAKLQEKADKVDSLEKRLVELEQTVQSIARVK